MKIDLKTYDNIRKIATGKGDDCTTGCFLDYPYFKKYYQLITIDFFLFFFLFNCCLVAPRPTSGHYRGDNLTHPMLITAFYIFDPKVTGSLVARLGP